MTYFKVDVFFAGRVGKCVFLFFLVVVFVVVGGVALGVFPGCRMLVFWCDPDCSAVAGDGVDEDVDVFRPLDSLAFVVGVVWVVGPSIKFDWMLFPISSGATFLRFNLSLLMLYFKSRSCCRLVLSLKNAGGLVDGWICTSKAMDPTRTRRKTARTTKRNFCIGTPSQWYIKLCSPQLKWQPLLCWPCWNTAGLGCRDRLRIRGTPWSNVPFGSSYIAKSLSLELGDGFCEVGGLLSSWTRSESSSSCTGLLVESSSTSDDDEVDDWCWVWFLSFPDRNWTMSSVK